MELMDLFDDYEALKDRILFLARNFENEDEFSVVEEEKEF